MPHPKVSISYSYDDSTHEEWVVRLATDLRANGVDTIFDKVDVSAGADLAAFMERGVAHSDRVVLVCSAPYVAKADGGVAAVEFRIRLAGMKGRYLTASNPIE